MSEKNKMDIKDDLIREALRQEIDCVKAPPADRVWKNISLSLEKPRPSKKRRSFNWNRAAAVAAACLVITMAGVGVFRSMDISAPLADPGIALEATDEAGVLEVESEDREIEVFDEDMPLEAAENGLPFGEPDPVPPDWPLSLPGNYILGETLLLTEGGAPFYRGAIYHSGAKELLFVKKKNLNKDLFDFINHLGGHMQVAFYDLEETNGFVRFSAGDLLGLAWQKNGRNQALLVLSGYVLKQDLKNIVHEID